MPYLSVHIAKNERRVVRESGYRTMPYCVSRFMLAPGEVYGRSPGMSVLGSIVQLNVMQKTIIRAAEKMVDPPVLAFDDDVLAGFSMQPSAIITGGLNEGGDPMVQPLQMGGNLPIGLEMVEARQRVVNEAYYINLFQVLVERPGDQTATEVVERAQEKAQLLAPAMGRQQSELLRGVIVRELDILSAGGLFESRPMPEALAASGAGVTPKYETEMTQALDSSDGVAVMRFLQALGGIAQMGPNAAGVLDLVDYDQAANVLRRSFAVPGNIMLDEDALNAMRQQRQQAEQAAAQMQQMAAMGQVGESFSGALGNLAKTGQDLQGVSGLMGGGMGGGQ
jgi:hypothetical protein